MRNTSVLRPGALPAPIASLVDAAIDAAAVVDLDLQLLYFNRSYERLSGLPLRVLRAGPHRAMCHSQLKLESCKDECLATRAVRSRRPVRMDEVRSESGLRLIVTATPLVDSDGSPYAILELYRDVTAESRMQEGYRALLDRERLRNETLQEAVRARTVELERSIHELTSTREQLVHSEKMSSLGRLVAGVAHELNNPINFIYGNMPFLEEHVGKLMAAAGRPMSTPSIPPTAADEAELNFVVEDLPQLLRAMREGAERAARIVSDLRTFSHAGRGHVRECDLRREIEVTLALVEPKARGRVVLRSELGALPKVRCDGSQISQVIMNLVVNAIDAIERDGTVTVRASTEEGYVSIEVEDDGQGIPQELLGRIFEPFFTMKEVGAGTGLGLSISYGIVQAHRGRLEVFSEVGKGTRFRLTLPTQGPEAVLPRDLLAPAAHSAEATR